MLEFCSQFRFLHLRHHRHVILHLPTKFRPNRTVRKAVMTSHPFLKMAARASQFYFRFGFRDFAHLGRPKHTCAPNFSEIPQSAAEILLLLVVEKKRNVRHVGILLLVATFVCVTMGMSFCICLSNFVQIGPSTTEL